jgi:hypothetical protein
MSLPVAKARYIQPIFIHLITIIGAVKNKSKSQIPKGKERTQKETQVNGYPGKACQH